MSTSGGVPRDPNYAYGRCPYCGGEANTGGSFNHRFDLRVKCPTLYGPPACWIAPPITHTPPAATVSLTLRFTGGAEVAVGRAVERDELYDDVVERRIHEMMREFLRVIRGAGVKTL